MPLPITVLIAVKNEEKNLPKCLRALSFSSSVVLLDSESTDKTGDIAKEFGAEVVQFKYGGGYPKKRQWAMQNLGIATPWTLLIDADEVVPPQLADEIRTAIERPDFDAYFITKGFHFLGRRFRFGGFSHRAVLLFRTGKARFERLFDDERNGLDMEVHERILVDGSIGLLDTPLIHEDFKGLEAYIDRHNKYSTWEAHLRFRYVQSGNYGLKSVRPRLFGNSQEQRRFLKMLIVRLPMEPVVWFIYHFVFRLGFLEGHRGLIACKFRAAYIAQVRAKMFELKLRAAATDF